MIRRLLEAVGLLRPDPWAKPIEARSSQWPKVRAEHLKRFPTCAACGTRENLNVHHIDPVHRNPALELDSRNLVTLCESPARNCHLCFGHLLNWKSWNVMVRVDAEWFLRKIRNRPT